MTPIQSTAKNTYSKRAELHRHALNPMSAFGDKADMSMIRHTEVSNKSPPKKVVEKRYFVVRPSWAGRLCC